MTENAWLTGMVVYDKKETSFDTIKTHKFMIIGFVVLRFFVGGIH